MAKGRLLNVLVWSESQVLTDHVLEYEGFLCRSPTNSTATHHECLCLRYIHRLIPYSLSVHSLETKKAGWMEAGYGHELIVEALPLPSA